MIERFAGPRFIGYFFAYSDRYPFDPTHAPGNCTVIADEPGYPLTVRHAAPGPLLLDAALMPAFADRWADVAAVWLSAGSVDALETMTRATRAQMSQLGLSRKPLVGYVDGPWSRASHEIEIAGLQAYQRAGERLVDFRQRVDAQIALLAPAARVLIVGQAYTSNATLTVDLLPLQPVLADLARDPACIGLIWFAWARPTGVLDHLELLPVHREIAAASPGVPTLEKAFVDPFKVDVKSYDPVIARGQDYRARFGIGNGIEIVVQKDAADELHFWVYRDGLLQDRSGKARTVRIQA